MSGPNPDYGFFVAPADGHELSDAECVDAVREFLAQVDPVTGYLE